MPAGPPGGYRCLKGRPRRSIRGLAVPAAVSQLIGEQPGNERPDVLIEVRAYRGDLGVHARLDLLIKEAGGVTFVRAASSPGHAVPDEMKRAASLFAGGIEAQVPQQRE